MTDAGAPEAAPPSPTCDVCAAPALPVGGACVFCDAPLEVQGDPAGLVEYLAGRIPGASVGRAGLLHRGAARRVEFTIGATEFRATIRREGDLELVPEGTPEQWAARIVSELGTLAPDDRAQRVVLSRTGWAWR